MPLYRVLFGIEPGYTMSIELEADDEESASDNLERHLVQIMNHQRRFPIDTPRVLGVEPIEVPFFPPFGEEQPIIDRMEQYGDDDGDPTRYDEDDPMYRGGPDEDMSWMDKPEEEEKPDDSEPIYSCPRLGCNMDDFPLSQSYVNDECRICCPRCHAVAGLRDDEEESN